MKLGSKNIQSLCYGSKGIIKAMFGSKLIWEKINIEKVINTILKSIIDGNELNNIDSLLSKIESSNKDFSDINNQLEEIIEGKVINMITFTLLDREYQVEEGMTFGDWLDTEEKFYSVFESNYNRYFDWSTGSTPAVCVMGYIIPEIYPNTVIHNGDIYSSPTDDFLNKNTNK